jgi:hypothetical protein
MCLRRIASLHLHTHGVGTRWSSTAVPVTMAFGGGHREYSLARDEHTDWPDRPAASGVRRHRHLRLVASSLGAAFAHILTRRTPG